MCIAAMLCQCLKKNKYRTLEFAEELAERLSREHNKLLRAYYCPICFHYHITHKSSSRRRE